VGRRRVVGENQRVGGEQGRPVDEPREQRRVGKRHRVRIARPADGEPSGGEAPVCLDAPTGYRLRDGEEAPGDERARRRGRSLSAPDRTEQSGSGRESAPAGERHGRPPTEESAPGRFHRTKRSRVTTKRYRNRSRLRIGRQSATSAGGGSEADAGSQPSRFSL
jgi:hypothetical protein